MQAVLKVELIEIVVMDMVRYGCRIFWYAPELAIQTLFVLFVGMKLSIPERTHSGMREDVLAALFLNSAEKVALVMYDLKLSQ